MKTIYKEIVSEIEAMDMEDLIQLNNIYAREIQGNFDNEIWENDEEFFNSFFDNKVIEAVRSVSFGDYRYNDNYVMFNGYGNLESFNYFGIEDLCEIPETMAEYIFENFSEFEHLFSDELKEEIENYEF